MYLLKNGKIFRNQHTMLWEIWDHITNLRVLFNSSVQAILYRHVYNCLRWLNTNLMAKHLTCPFSWWRRQVEYFFFGIKNTQITYVWKREILELQKDCSSCTEVAGVEILTRFPPNLEIYCALFKKFLLIRTHVIIWVPKAMSFMHYSEQWWIRVSIWLFEW